MGGLEGTNPFNKKVYAEENDEYVSDDNVNVIDEAIE